MFIIYLSEANINNLISGLLVLSGVAIAPLIAFFTTLFNRKHDEKLSRKNEIKPQFSVITTYMSDLLSELLTIYNKYHQKSFKETSEIYNEHPFDIFDTLDELYNKVRNVGKNGYMLFPKKPMKNIVKFVTDSQTLITYVNRSLMSKNDIVDLTSFYPSYDDLQVQYSKFIDSARSYLGL